MIYDLLRKPTDFDADRRADAGRLKTNFTTLLLMAEKSFTSCDGRTIQLYRMTPLYTEERDLEIREGLPALMRALDRLDISSTIDLN